MRLRLQNLARKYKQIIMMSFDIFTLLVALYLSFVLRLGEAFPSDYIYGSWWLFFAPWAIKQKAWDLVFIAFLFGAFDLWGTLKLGFN